MHGGGRGRDSGYSIGQSRHFLFNQFWSREDKGDREGIPHTHPIP